MTSLDTRALAAWILEVTGWGALFGAAALGIESLTGAGWAKALVAAFVAAGVAYMILRYRSWRFEVMDDALYLERGVFNQVKTIVPLVRIQHVDSRRTPKERIMGLASVVVYTAGSQGSDARIPGLKPEHAERLQDELKQHSIETQASQRDAV